MLARAASMTASAARTRLWRRGLTQDRGECKGGECTVVSAMCECTVVSARASTLLDEGQRRMEEGSVVAVVRSVHAQRAVVACRGHARRRSACVVVRGSHHVR